MSIVLGYKLFEGGAAPKDGSDVNAYIDKVKIIFRNIGPGVFFAGFEAFIIYTMLSQGNPELIAELCRS